MLCWNGLDLNSTCSLVDMDIPGFLLLLCNVLMIFCCFCDQRSGYEVYLLEASYKDPTVSFPTSLLNIRKVFLMMDGHVLNLCNASTY